MFDQKNGIKYKQSEIPYEFYIGLRVLGKKGTKIEGLIGTVFSIDNSIPNCIKLGINFIMPADESIVSLVRSKCNIPNNIGMAVSLSAIIAEASDVYSLPYIVEKVNCEYNALYKRYKLTTGIDKKNNIYKALVSHSNVLEQITNSCIFTGYLDYSKIDDGIL